MVSIPAMAFGPEYDAIRESKLFHLKTYFQGKPLEVHIENELNDNVKDCQDFTEYVLINRSILTLLLYWAFCVVWFKPGCNIRKKCNIFC